MEFKGAMSLEHSLNKPKSKHDELSKDVSAMANSNGGILIYGIHEFNEGPNKGRAEKIDPISNHKISAEWLDQVVNSRISPRISNLKIHQIEIEPESFVYVLEIPKSTTAHQAQDNRYYKRFNLQAVAMDDWEVKDVVGRGNKPILDVSFGVFQKLGWLAKTFDCEYEIELTVHNIGNIAAEYINCFLEIDIEAIKHLQQSDFSRHEKHIQFMFTNRRTELIKAKDGASPVRKLLDFEPLLPQVYRRIGIIKVKESFFENDFKIVCKTSTEKSSKNFEFISSAIYSDEGNNR